MAAKPTPMNATALAKLRHLYQNMVNGGVRDTAGAKRIAEGLLAPAIEQLERGTPPPAVAREPVSEGFIEMMRPMHVEPAAFAAGIRFAEQHHGITKESP